VLALILVATGGGPGAPDTASGAETDYLTVELGPDQTIRQVAQEYLADADLWPEILKASGYASITDISPGAALRIPANEISSANRALALSLDQIQSANLAGAQIFAPQEIRLALDLREEALLQRLERQWLRTRSLAEQSYDQATDALEKSEARRDKAAEALVSDRTGNVEGQRPEDLAWRYLQLRAVLIEEEKVRTLSDSTAQITFRDASRLRLNENSNAIIQRMRYDPLSRKEEAKVSLVEGDFYAILSSDKTRKQFNVEIPEVNATIDSGDFWVSNRDAAAKFANYDDKAVRIETRGDVIDLGRNEGTVIEAGQGAGEVRQVLPPPQAIAPANAGIVYAVAPELSWTAVDGAAGYWLEIAADQGFNRLVDSRFGLESPDFRPDPLVPGEYFWRTAALDGFGLPGERSAASSFTVAIDETPPFLRIQSPPPGAIIREARVRISGEVEPGAALTVDGEALDPDAAGRFETTVTAREGQNTVIALAVDAAGNEIRRERSFVHMPDRESAIRFAEALRRGPDGGFLSDDQTISLRGTTTENATLEVRSEAGSPRASAVAGADGSFEINVPLEADSERFTIAVIAPSGFTTSEQISVGVDRAPPDLAIDELPPRLTSDPALTLSGRTEPDVTLSVNGERVALDGDRFEATVALAEGANAIEVIAADPAGNVTVGKWTVGLDRVPPELVTSTLTQTAEASGVALVAEVVAEDASGLAKVAPVTVTAGGKAYTGYLRYNRADKTYSGSVSVPAETAFLPIAVEVALVDDAGNEKTYRLDETDAATDGGGPADTSESEKDN